MKPPHKASRAQSHRHASFSSTRQSCTQTIEPSSSILSCASLRLAIDQITTCMKVRYLVTSMGNSGLCRHSTSLLKILSHFGFIIHRKLIKVGEERPIWKLIVEGAGCGDEDYFEEAYKVGMQRTTNASITSNRTQSQAFQILTYVYI